MIALFPLALAADPVTAEQGALAAVGDTIDGATVSSVITHPDFERYTLDKEGATLVVELTLADPVHTGLCAAGGLALFPRPDLVGGELASVDAGAWCARLDDVAGSRKIGRIADSPGAPMLPQPAAESRTLRWALGLAATFGLALGFWAMRAAWRGAVLAGLGALAVRLLAVEPGTFNGAGAQFEKLLLAWGELRGSPYGPGYALASLPSTMILGDTSFAIFTSNLVYSCITVVFVYVLVARESASRWAAGAAALSLSLATPALLLSRSESMHVPGVAMAVLACLLAAETRRAERLGLATALGLGSGAAAWVASWIRPDLLVAVPAAMAFALGRRGVPALLGLCMAAAGRAASLDGGGGELLRPEAYVQVATWVEGLRPRWGFPGESGGFALLSATGFTSPAWWLLAALGFLARPHREAGWRWLPWLLLGTLPFVPKAWPLADAIRLQYFGHVALAGLVGLGAGPLRGRGIFLAGILLLPWLGRVQPRWATHEEWRFLERTVPDLPAGSVVQSAAYGHRNESFRRVMATLGSARWVESGEADIVYRGIGEPPPGGVPIAEYSFEHDGDLDIQLPSRMVTLGFYSVRPTASTGHDSTAN